MAFIVENVTRADQGLKFLVSPRFGIALYWERIWNVEQMINRCCATEIYLKGTWHVPVSEHWWGRTILRDFCKHQIPLAVHNMWVFNTFFHVELWIYTFSFIYFAAKLSNWSWRPRISDLGWVESPDSLSSSWSWQMPFSITKWRRLLSSDINLPNWAVFLDIFWANSAFRSWRSRWREWRLGSEVCVHIDLWGVSYDRFQHNKRR